MDEKLQTVSEVTGGGAAQSGQDDQVTESDIAEKEEIGDPEASEEKAETNPKTDGGNQPKPESKPKQSRAENAKYADMRRAQKEKEKREAEIQEAEKRGQQQAEIEFRKKAITSDDLKELGLENVDDDRDLFLAEKYREAKAKGSEDPKLDAYQALTNRYRIEVDEAKKQAKMEAERNKKAYDDAVSFKKAYGKAPEQIMNDDPNFKEFFDRFGEIGKCTDCYQTYLKIRSLGPNQKPKDDEASKKAGAYPSTSSGSSKSLEYETEEEFNRRTLEAYGPNF